MSGTTTELQVITQQANEEDNPTNKTFHIYCYFKAHPSFFLAVMSAFIAVLSIILNFAAFLNMNSYLMYFQVDRVFYEPATQFVYQVAVSLFFSIILVLFQVFISRTFECYLPYKRVLLLQKFSLKRMRKRINGSKKRRASIEKILRDIPFFSSESDKSDNIQKDLMMLNEEAKEIKKEYIAIKKEVQKSRILFFLLIFLSCFLMWIILYMSLTFMISFSSYKRHNVFSSAMLFSIIYVSVFAIINWFLLCFLRLDKKKLKFDIENRIEHTTYFADDNFTNFPIQVLFDGKLKDLFNDSNCKKVFLTIIFSFVALLLVMSSSGSDAAAKQRDFFIVNIDSQAYALIYNNGESVVLEKAEIVDKTINIDSTHQKVIPSNSLDMEKRTFENVNILRIGDTYNEQGNVNFAEAIYQKAKKFVRHMLTHIKSLNIIKNEP